jgi:hypothetical protein
MKIYLPHTDETTSEQYTEGMRLHRDRLLQQSDFAMAPDAPTDKKAWTEYRQELRDFPATWEPSEVVEFPSAPNEALPQQDLTDNS